MEELLRQIRDKYPFVDIWAFESKDRVELQQIKIPHEHRGSGIGTEIIRLLQNYARSVGKPIVLRPEPEKGKKAALKRFYKRLGFVDNSGRNKDYTLSSPFSKTMYWRFREWLESNQEVTPFPNSTVQHLVYHGTDQHPFKQFSYQKSQRFVLFSSIDVEAKGFFFSESPHDALDFGKNVVACYIDMKKPLIDPRRDRHLRQNRLSDKHEIDLQKILAPMIQKDDYGHYMDIGVGRHYIQTRRREYAREWIYDAIFSDGLSWDVLDNPNVVQRMIKLGYDGTFVAEPDTYLGRSIFIPSPDQIRIVEWARGAQDSWGDKDDYYVSNKDGYGRFNSPQRLTS